MKLNLKLLLILLVFSTSALAQTEKLPKDWKQFNACVITFFAPNTLKDLHPEGVDSCIASFGNKNIVVSIDYGWYGGRFSKYKDMYIDFNEEDFEINGKKAQFATYTYSDKYAHHIWRKFVAGIYVEVNSLGGEVTSLNMKVSGKTKKDIEIAKQIFSTIKFDK